MLSLTDTPGNGVPPTTPCAERRIRCVAGIRPIPNSPQNEAWIRSPKTGNELVLSDGWWPELKERAPHVIARIIHNRASGLSVTEFSLTELSALVEVRNLIAEKCKPLPTGGLYRRCKVNRRGRPIGRRW